MLQSKEKWIKKTLKTLNPQKIKVSVTIMLIIIIVSGFVLIIAYQQARNQMEEISMDLIATRCEENAKLLGRNFEHYQKTLYSLATDNDIFWLKNWNKYSDAEKLDIYYSTSTRIRSIEVPDVDILDLYACFPSQKIVLANGLYKMDDYSIIQQEQYENLKASEINFIIESSESSNGNMDISEIFLVHKVGYNVMETGFVTMQLNPSAVKNILESGNDFSNEAIYTTDSEGNVVYSDGEYTLNKWQEMIASTNGSESAVIKLGKESYYIVASDISTTGWVYRIAIPIKNLILGNHLDTSMIFIGAVLLAMALAFGILGAQFALRPIERLYQSVSKRSKQHKQADRSLYLSRVFDKIFDENYDLRSMAQRNLPLLRDKVLMQMVMQPNTEINDRLMPDNLGISFKERFFRVVVVQYQMNESGVNPAELLKVEMFNEYWNEILKSQGTCHMVIFEPLRFFIIINYKDIKKSETYWIKWFNDEVNMFNNEFHCEITGGISLEKTSVSELNQAFLEALRTFERQLIVGPGFVESYKNQIPYSNQRLVYPFEMFEKLINELRNFNKEKAYDILDNISSFIRNNPPQSKFALRQIFLYMSGSLQQLLLEIDEEFHIDNQTDIYMAALVAAQDIDSHIECFTELAEQIMDSYEKFNNGQRKSLFKKIERYIHLNYIKMLTPEDIAAHFYISNTYLYRIMKSEGKISPARYLTGVRLSKATELIETSSISLKNIAKECGFESEQSFYRNFKKAYGMPPSQYRRLRSALKSDNAQH